MTATSLPGWLTRWPEEDAQRLFLCLLAAATAGRLLLLALLPLDLSGDEAYYWEWGRRLDWGYFSKPPGIAWLMALASRVAGSSAFALRAVAVMLGSGALILLYALGSRLYDGRTGLAAALVFAVLPGSAGLSLILTIDAPLVSCWIGALYAFWRFIEDDPPTSPWGVALAAFIAGGVLSKQMMLVFPLVALLHLALNPARRRLLRRPVLWLVLLAPLLVLVPTLAWNASHGWITFGHTMHHFEAADATVGAAVGRFFEFLAMGLGLVTPVLFVLLSVVVLGGLAAWRRLGERERYLWLACGPALIVMALMSLRQSMNANWPAVYLPSGIVLLVGWAAGHWRLGLGVDSWRRSFPAGVVVALAFSALTYGTVIAFAAQWLPSPSWDPTRRIRGWSELGRAVAAERSRLPQPESLLTITQGHRYLTSELAFYLPEQPRVYRFEDTPGVVSSQYSLWQTPAPEVGRSALLVVEGPREALHPELRERFREVRFLTEIDHRQRFGHRRRYALFFGRELQRWP